MESGIKEKLKNDGWYQRRSEWEDELPGNQRPPEEADRSRVIHCASFRRLQGKTQTLGMIDSDFHRTRLTHSMEVAQIARAIVLQLVNAPSTRGFEPILPSIPLIETIGLSHDLGHPPFGHTGEIALNYMMRDHGGFEGNGQSLRIVSHLELHTRRSNVRFGIDPVRRALLGILKYPAKYKVVNQHQPTDDLPKTNSQLNAFAWIPPKCYLDTEALLVDWILAPISKGDRDNFVTAGRCDGARHFKTRHKSIDTSIMEIADDVAYATHDLEDAIVLGLVTRDQWESATKVALTSNWAKDQQLDYETLSAWLFKNEQSTGNRKLAIGRLIHAFECSVSIKQNDEFEYPLLSHKAELDAEAETLRHALTGLIRDHIINTQRGQTLEYRGRMIVMSLFEAIQSDPKNLVPDKFKLGLASDDIGIRDICDYIAGMTDTYASRLYERLFVPRQGSFFEHL